ncbi:MULTISPECIES: restriction endonuclease subunit S [Cyanophyceae]|uniref:restriction endonuclease subunit S n=1 Tax=Cyanophyceae TaxID=3028117 RepID=UPI00198B03FD|nr:restriction endonuclease subunit S [Trichocoleus sp. FACHB-40]MBD2006498.1 restriction endonuclease subunit S [Trichocoleus sp. FACHB-40]
MTTEVISQQQDKRKLPNGWRWMKLGDVLEVKSGNFLPAKAMSISGIYPVYGGNGINGYHDEFLFDEPKIVIGRVGALCGCIHLSHPKSWITDNALYVSKKKVNFDNNFMVRCLRFLDLNKQSNSMAQPLISGKIIYPIEIPLPPLDEQKRIAAILDEQMEAVERSRQATLTQLEAAKALPAAYLRAVFNSLEAQKWERKSVSQLISSQVLLEHQDGNHGELHPRNKDFVSSGVKFVTAKYIKKDGTLALNNAPHITKEQANGLRIGFAKGNDILLAHNATVGPVAIAPSDCEPFVIGTSLTIYRPVPSVMLPQFLFLALKSEDFQNQLVEAMKQTTRNQVPITRQRQMTLLLPPLTEQERIAANLTEQLTEVERLQQSLKSQLDAINRLPAILLRRAFNGEV